MTKIDIARLVPNHIQANYPVFVDFVQAYYDWLKAEHLLNGVEKIVDLEETPIEFITYFKKQLARDIPENIHCCRRLFYQRIKDLYAAKGTESAYKLLFRLVYGQEADIIYPSQQVLRASDGRWKQDISIFVSVNYGDINSVIEKSVTIQTNSNRFNVYVKNVVQVDDNVFELFIDKQYSGVISVSNYIITPNLRATVLTTISSVKILSGGSGFKIGEIFSIKASSGTTSTIKVVEVGSGGSLKRVQLIRFGYGYSSTFVNYILSGSNAKNSSTPELVESSSSGINSNEYYYDINERGFINRQTYLQTNTLETPAWDSSYVGEIIGEFIYDNKSNVNSELYASVAFTLGAIAKYPGYYTSNDGFLNDSIYLQDSYYYQDFSYVVRIDQQLEVYKELLKSIIHPTGLALFGEYDITNKFTIDINLKQSGSVVSLLLNDTVYAIDEISSKELTKEFSDSQEITDSVEKTFSADKYSMLDNTNIADSGQIIYSSPSDYGGLTYSINYFETQSNSF